MRWLAAWTKASMPVDASAKQGFSRVLLALIVGQVGVHATMAGVRMAAPLQALRDGQSALSVGMMLALYAAAPVLIALPAGRMADRLGYHRPVQLAIIAAVVGALLAALSTLVPQPWCFALLGLSALLLGSGANVIQIATQHTAGATARDATERVRVFSWLGVAPSFSNVVGPVMAGFVIDGFGFGWAYVALALLPLVSWWAARRVPRRAPRAPLNEPGELGKRQTAWDLFNAPGMRRLMSVNWLLSSAWDVHTFAVPILGHEYGFSASSIGLVLGSFTLAVSAVRLVVPVLAHRIERRAVLGGAMLATGIVMLFYPFATTPGRMVCCALAMGLAMGAVQPMIMSTLHDLAPPHRHGQAIALRSMVMNGSSTLMPLLFGVAGAAVGAASLFWFFGTALGAGAWLTRKMKLAEV